MFFDFLPRFARAARAPGFGKRTNRVEARVDDELKLLLQEKLAQLGGMTESDYIFTLLKASLIGVREIQRIETDLLKGVCGLSGLFPPEDRT